MPSEVKHPSPQTPTLTTYSCITAARSSYVATEPGAGLAGSARQEHTHEEQRSRGPFLRAPGFFSTSHWAFPPGLLPFGAGGSPFPGGCSRTPCYRSSQCPAVPAGSRSRGAQPHPPGGRVVTSPQPRSSKSDQDINEEARLIPIQLKVYQLVRNVQARNHR